VHNRLAVAIAAMWKEALGVETELYAEEFRALLQTIQARKDTQCSARAGSATTTTPTRSPSCCRRTSASTLRLLEPAIRRPARRGHAPAGPGPPPALLEEAERVMLATTRCCRSILRQQAPREPYVSGWSDNVMNVQYSKDLRLDGDG